MKKLSTLLILLLGFQYALLAQSLSEMEARFNRASTPKSEQLDLSYKIAEQIMRSSSVSVANAKKASDFAYKASVIAKDLKDTRREAGAYLIGGDAFAASRNPSSARQRYMQCFETAKKNGHNDYAVTALDKLLAAARASNNTVDAVKWGNEALIMAKGGKTSAPVSTGSTTADRSKLESQVAGLQNENLRLREELSRTTGRSELLETNYRETETKLKEIKTKAETELTKKDQTIERVSDLKNRSDSLARSTQQRVQYLTKEQVANELIISQKEKELKSQELALAEAELSQKNSENLRNIFGLLAILVMALAGFIFLRYRAKKRTAMELTEKNAQIEAERKRSDELLLNILPRAIANELRTNAKVKPQKYEQATVMFCDFKGFTNVSERLTPEMLVEEIDYCFSNFDRIISQYRIEKIKTIGDAYMCASGLSDMNASPSDMVKASLEMQDFLQHLKAERMSRGLPYFEARIGIHTGPVVAGVVGTKKFAYDIWGDTVNIAARMEEACEIGKVNVSETAHWLAKYEFEWHNRGKIAAKNKGMIDMFYVTSIKGGY